MTATPRPRWRRAGPGQAEYRMPNGYLLATITKGRAVTYTWRRLDGTLDRRREGPWRARTPSGGYIGFGVDTLTAAKAAVEHHYGLGATDD